MCFTLQNCKTAPRHTHIKIYYYNFTINYQFS